MNTKNGPQIKGIIFDLDGTLYHMKWFLKPVITIKLFPDVLLLPRYMAVRKKFFGLDLGSNEALMNAITEELAKKTPGASAKKMRSWIMNRFYPSFEKSMRLMRGSRPGVENLLASLKTKNIRLAVLSDFASIHERLKALEIPPSLFDLCVSAESKGCVKPSARPLTDICNTWDLDPAFILVIGDREDTDGAAAEKSGMNFIRITDKKSGRPDAGTLWPELSRYLYQLPAVSPA